MNTKIIDGKKISEDSKKNTKKEISNINGRPPCLAVILVGNDPASTIYVKNKVRSCLEVGIKSREIKFEENSKEKDILAILEQLNIDQSIDGILVQLPLPSHISSEKILAYINPLKDVDCFHPENVGLLNLGIPRFTPGTPLGIIEILKHESFDFQGKHAVIIGRSNIVGRPMQSLLLSLDCTTTIVHSKTRNIESILKSADLIVVAIGHKHFIKSNMVNEGVAIIDVGINRVQNRLYGDVDLNGLLGKASLITPVPGGVGPMTVAMLMANTLKASYLN